MKNRKEFFMNGIKKLSVLLIALTLCSFFISCGSKSKFVGTWYPKEKMSSNYPENIMVLNKDGSGTVDGFSCNWIEKDGELMLTSGIVGRSTYDYEFRGSKFYLDGYEYTKK